MKFIICITLFYAVALFDTANTEVTPEISQIAKDCRIEFKINDPEKYWQLNIGTLAIAYVTPDMKCYLNCFMEKAGILKDGKLQTDGSAKLFNDYAGEATAKAVLKSCRGEIGTNKCETAFKLHSCFVKNFEYYVLQYYQNL